MKKFIRIATVFALSCAALLYTGCTKDYSGEINTLQKEVEEVQKAVKALDEFKTQAQIDIKAAKEQGTANAAAIAAAQEQLDGLEAYVDQIASYTVSKIQFLSKYCAALTEAIGALGVEIENLYAKLEAVDKALAELSAKIAGVASRVTGISAFPSETVTNLFSANFNNADSTNYLFIRGRFLVSPSAAVADIKEEDIVTLCVVRYDGTKAAVRDTTKIKALKAVILKADKNSGIIEVLSKVAEGSNVKSVKEETAIAYALKYTGSDAAGKYQITSDFEVADNKFDRNDAVKVYFADSVKSSKGFVLDSIKVDYTKKADTVLFSGVTPAYQIYRGVKVSQKQCDSLKVNTGVKISYQTFDFSATTAPVSVKALQTPFVFVEGVDSLKFTTKTAAATAPYVGRGAIVKKIATIYPTGSADTAAVTESYRLLRKQIALSTLTFEKPWNYVNYEKTEEYTDLYDTIKLSGADAAFIKGAITSKTVKLGGREVKPEFDVEIVPGDTAIALLAYLPVYSKDTTYKFQFTSTSVSEEYTLNLNYKVKAAPAVTHTTLADINVKSGSTEKVTGNFTYSSLPIMQTIVPAAKTAEFIGGLKDTSKVSFYKAFANCGGLLGENFILDSVKVNGKANANGFDYFGYSLQYTTKEASYIWRKALTFGNEYVAYFSIEAFGIKFTFSQKFIVEESKSKLNYTGYVQDSVALAIGAIKSGTYTIESMHINNYLTVSNVNGEEYDINYTTKYLTSQSGKVNPASDCIWVNKTTGLIDRDPVMEWNTLKDTTFAFKAVLVDGEWAKPVDSTYIVFKTPAPVVFPANWLTELTETRVAGERTKIDLSKALKYYGVLDKDQEVNLAEIEDESTYDSEYTFDDSKLTATVNGQPFTLIKDDHYTFKDGKTFKLIAENVPGVLVINIPVTVTYYLDGVNHCNAKKGTLKVTINPAE